MGLEGGALERLGVENGTKRKRPIFSLGGESRRHCRR
jgi:hypothetical protein